MTVRGNTAFSRFELDVEEAFANDRRADIVVITGAGTPCGCEGPCQKKGRGSGSLCQIFN